MSGDPRTQSIGERYCPSCERSYAPSVERCPDDGTSLVRLQDAGDSFEGRELEGRFTLKQRLGAGGMGAVYRAIQHSVGREVAIKIVNPTLTSDPAAAKRFLREAKLGSRLVHPHIVSMLDFGQTSDGLFYLVMELLHGRTLAHLRADEGAILPERAARIGAQICDALEVAHRQAIVHRDLKPANVIVLDQPRGRDVVKVLDFGLAKSLSGESTTTVTASGAVLGTVGSSRVDLQACKLEYSIVSPK